MVSHLAAIITAIATVATIKVSAQADYWQSFKTQVNPANISIPSIAQTTSLEPSVECTYYNPDPAYISINASEFPTIWQVATTNGMASSSEFLDLYNLIDWNSAPNIQPRKKNPDGSLDFTGYPSSDPDCWWSSSLCTTPKHPGINEDIVACNEPETWGLTYDDGPNCSHNVFYDYLREHDYKATMFYIGSNVIDWPYGAMRGMQDGHHIGAHTWSHEYTTTLTNQEVLAEFYYTQKAIKLATGVTPRYWRPVSFIRISTHCKLICVSSLMVTLMTVFGGLLVSWDLLLSFGTLTLMIGQPEIQRQCNRFRTIMTLLLKWEPMVPLRIQETLY